MLPLGLYIRHVAELLVVTAVIGSASVNLTQFVLKVSYSVK